ncbi:hypothetical protein OPQ81_011899 [Rhizoctonia solani]|nr:hypothetical protein OPQ81_011899 [Rhizoctonia solani]
MILHLDVPDTTREVLLCCLETGFNVNPPGVGGVRGDRFIERDVAAWTLLPEPRIYHAFIACLQLSLRISPIVFVLHSHLSTPAQSPRSSPTSSEQFVEHLIDPTGVTEDFSLFTLNLLPSEVTLPDSSSETSLDTVAYDLNDELFSLQLGSTEYFIARDRLELYKQLSSVHIDSNFRSLAPEDHLHLVSLHHIKYPMPPTSSAYTPAPMTTPGNPSSTSNTATISTIIITDKNYLINKLQGQEDYQIWHIQMEDMFQDVEVWDIVNKSST